MKGRRGEGKAGKGKERTGQDRKGKARQGKERKRKERKGKEEKGRGGEGRGKGREGVCARAGVPSGEKMSCQGLLESERVLLCAGPALGIFCTAALRVIWKAPRTNKDLPSCLYENLTFHF